MSKPAPRGWGNGNLAAALKAKQNTAATATATKPAATQAVAAPAPAPAPAPVAIVAPTPVPAVAPVAAAVAAEKVQEKTQPHANGTAPAAGTPAPAIAPEAAIPNTVLYHMIKSDGDDGDDGDGKDAKSAPAASPSPDAAAAADGDEPADADAANGDDANGADGDAKSAVRSSAGNADGRNPLQHEWTMWYEVSKKGKTSQKTYAPERKKIMSFDTVEDFWCLWNNILKPSELSAKRGGTDKTDYLLFKSGVQPEWEANKGGGQWELKLGKNPEDIDDQWELSVLGMIGDQFDDSEDILGAAIRLRPKGSRLELWTKEASGTEAVLRIGARFKEIAQYQSRISFASFRQLSNGESKPMHEV